VGVVEQHAEPLPDEELPLLGELLVVLRGAAGPGALSGGCEVLLWRLGHGGPSLVRGPLPSAERPGNQSRTRQGLVALPQAVENAMECPERTPCPPGGSPAPWRPSPPWRCSPCPPPAR